MKMASIDIGTNSILCLIANATNPTKLEPLLDLCEIPRLGEGLSGDLLLKPQAISRCLAVLKRYQIEIRKAGIAPERARVIATAGMRRAKNAQAFIDLIAQQTGFQIEVIDGKKEAFLSYLGVVNGLRDLLSPQATLLIMDIGGGSTELIRAPASAKEQHIELSISLPLGSVWLTEKFLKEKDPPSSESVELMRIEIEHVLQTSGMNWGDQPIVIGLAGTVTTLAALSLKMKKYDPETIQGFCLKTSVIDKLIETLLPMPYEQRKNLPGLQPERADVIVAGAVIAFHVLNKSRAQELIVSDQGIRYGALYELLAGLDSIN